MKRAIKACCYLNRLLRDGMDTDFLMEKVYADDEDRSSEKSIALMQDAACQTMPVDGEALIKP